MRLTDFLYLGVMLILGYWALLKLAARQFEKLLEVKFKAQEEAMSRHLAEEEKVTKKLETLEREFRDWKGELPVKYVLREDYIRGQVTIEAKQDALHAETKVVQLQLERLIGNMEGKST